MLSAATDHFPLVKNKYQSITCNLTVNKIWPPISQWCTESQLLTTFGVVCNFLAKRGVQREKKYTLREDGEFHLLQDTMLGRIIYCFQAPTGFITHSSYYFNMKLWRTHKRVFLVAEHGRKSSGGEKGKHKMLESREANEGKEAKEKKCTGTMSEKGEYTLFISFCLKVVITCSITAGIASRPPMILRKCIS